eukprot:GHVU01050788.1.p1 GENE.GHVU01050788.1~~GHVU01050788.1.p1  ORF type:complete len:107 (+),score=2.77 GHVU01050788.1:383-703(+)
MNKHYIFSFKLLRNMRGDQSGLVTDQNDLPKFTFVNFDSRVKFQTLTPCLLCDKAFNTNKPPYLSASLQQYNIMCNRNTCQSNHENKILQVPAFQQMCKTPFQFYC